MDRYTIGFLILVGWFVCFRMFPARIGQDRDDTSPKSVSYQARVPDADEGPWPREKELFMLNCARCHNSRLEKQGTGPALYGVSSRIPGRDWIYRWIRNSGKMIQEGDAYALMIWKKNQKASMDSFPSLSEAQIDSMMRWIDGYSLGPTP